jgi:hypothetical protein
MYILFQVSKDVNPDGFNFCENSSDGSGLTSDDAGMTSDDAGTTSDDT